MKKVVLGVLLLLSTIHTAVALNRFDELTVVVDTTVSTTAGAASRQEGIEITSSGVMRIIEFGAPVNIQIEAFDRTPAGTLLVPDTTTEFAGVTVSPRDVLRLAPDGSGEIAFAAETIGIEPPAKIASVESYGPGILFTLNISSVVSGVAVSPRDIAYFDGQETTILAFSDEIGISPPSKITGLESSSQGNLIFSIDTGSTGSNQSFNHGSLFLFDLNTGSVVQAEPRETTIGFCLTCRLVAISGELSEDVIFRSYFSSLEAQ